MVAYSFKARFEDLIRNGRKRQTIRGHRKRHARPGEPLQLYVGMRTRACRKIVPDPRCIAVRNIGVWVPTKLEPAAIVTDGGMEYVSHAFATADGFDSVQDFTRFWFDTHGPGRFDGVLIAWDPDA